MTRLLEKVLSRASKLSPAMQDELAARWLEELDDDARWDAKFDSSKTELAKLTGEVRAKIREGHEGAVGLTK